LVNTVSLTPRKQVSCLFGGEVYIHLRVLVLMADSAQVITGFISQIAPEYVTGVKVMKLLLGFEN
jgi:hypothetical protein